MMLTHPVNDPRKRLSEPVQRLETSLLAKSCCVSSSGREIWATSKKSNDFHYTITSQCSPDDLLSL